MHAFHHYFLHREFPEILDCGIVDKVLEYHELKHKKHQDQLRNAEKSQTFLEKEILNDIGKGIDIGAEKGTIEEREKEMDKLAKDHYTA